MAGNQVDAVAELERIDSLGTSNLDDSKKPLPRGMKALVIISVVVCAVLLTFVFFKAYRIKQAASAAATETHTPAQKVGTGGRTFQRARLQETAVAGDEGAEAAEAAPAPAPAPITPTAYTATPTAQNAPTSGQQGAPAPAAKPEKSPAELLLERRLSADLTGPGISASGIQATGNQAKVEGGSSGGGSLADNMQPVRFNAASAGVLPNRDLLVTQGEMIDCQLDTKVITSLPGQIRCFLTRDVYSTSKRVVLMEKGSLVIGQYQKGITQGQARIFVLWTRVETNKGVIINLDSSGSGPLGEAGLGGWVDTHFWERFGGAIMLSMIDDIGDFVSRQASGSNNDNRITFDNTSDASQDMATEALKHTIDIPPTLYKNHGEQVQIFVARDLDFSGVYSLERS